MLLAPQPATISNTKAVILIYWLKLMNRIQSKEVRNYYRCGIPLSNFLIEK